MKRFSIPVGGGIGGKFVFGAWLFCFWEAAGDATNVALTYSGRPRAAAFRQRASTTTRSPADLGRG